jgi:hypothetical protein
MIKALYFDIYIGPSTIAQIRHWKKRHSQIFETIFFFFSDKFQQYSAVLDLPIG